MDRIGRKQTMTLGFLLWGLLGFILGGALGPIVSNPINPSSPYRYLHHKYSPNTKIAKNQCHPSHHSLILPPPQQTVFPLFVVLYGIFNALGEMGPGVATFLTAAESFPTPLRGHYMGLAAAVGKAGAAIGTQVFTPIQNSLGSGLKGQQGVFLIGSAFAIVGGLIAWVLIPDMGRELESEDSRFRRYLEENGFDTSGLGGESLVGEVKGTAFKLETE